MKENYKLIFLFNIKRNIKLDEYILSSMYSEIVIVFKNIQL